MEKDIGQYIDIWKKLVDLQQHFNAIGMRIIDVWATFYFMDRHRYHRLLNGAVEATRPIEEAIRKVIPELDLSGHIRRESPIAFRLLGKTITLHTKDKTDVVHGAIALLIIVAAVIFLLPGRVCS